MKISSLLDQARTQAAVIRWFQTDWIQTDPETIDDLVAGECSRVTVDDGSRQWALDEGPRRQALQDVSLSEIRNLIADARSGAPIAPLTEVVEYLDRPVDLATVEVMDLTNLALGIDWLEGNRALSQRLPATEDIRIEIARTEALRPIAGLLDAGFVGRSVELDQMIGFIDGADNRLMTVTGPGGSGKSTLVARALLDPEGRARHPFAYLTFDERRMDPNDPSLLLIEIVRQLGLQSGMIPAELRNATGLVEQLTRGGPDISSRDSTGPLSFSTLPTEVVDVIRSTADITDRLVLVLDTFEELQRRDYTSFLAMGGLIDELTRSIDELRVIAAGRARIESLYSRDDPIVLGALDRSAAYDMMRLRLDDEQRFPDAVVNQLLDALGAVPLLPLVVRLTADLVAKADSGGRAQFRLEDHPTLLADLHDAEVEGILYSRFLKHIADKEVRRLAHPGLILRHVTPELILHVLAGPCDLSISDLSAARSLFSALAAESTLVEHTGDRLVHRSDVRAVMLPLIRAADRDRAREVHKAAVVFYSECDDEDAKLEELYHRLMLGQTQPQLMDVWMAAGAQTWRSLIPAFDEFPATSQVFLAGELDLHLDEETRESASNDEWLRAVLPEVELGLARGQVEHVVTTLQERRGPRGESLAPRHEVQALERADRLTEALHIATEARLAATETDDVLLIEGLTLDIARIHERAGQADLALDAVQPMLDRVVAGSDVVAAETYTDEERARAMVTATTWLRLVDELDYRIATSEARAATAALARSTSGRTWRERPSLLRDVVGYVGDIEPRLLIEAPRTLGVGDLSDQQRATFDEAMTVIETSFMDSPIDTSLNQAKFESLRSQIGNFEEASSTGDAISEMLEFVPQSTPLRPWIQQFYREKGFEAQQIQREQ